MMQRRSRRSPAKLLSLLVLVALVGSAGWVAWRHHRTPVATVDTVQHAAAKANGKPTAAQAAPGPKAHTDTGLQQVITAWAGQHAFDTSVVVREITGDDLRTADYRATASVVPASTYKLYVAYAVLHGMEQGKYTMDTVLDDGNSLQTDLNNMILNSNNDAAHTLGFLYGWAAINTLLETQGVMNTDLNNYAGGTSPVSDKHTTAADLATIVGKLYAGQLLNPTDTRLLLGLMEHQNYRERIPAGVPSGVTVADKPGWLTGNDDPGVTVQNDAAIVYGPKSTYILVITTTGSSTRPLADLSQQIYSYLENGA